MENHLLAQYFQRLQSNLCNQKNLVIFEQAD